MSGIILADALEMLCDRSSSNLKVFGELGGYEVDSFVESPELVSDVVRLTKVGSAVVGLDVGVGTSAIVINWVVDPERVAGMRWGYVTREDIISPNYEVYSQKGLFKADVAIANRKVTVLLGVERTSGGRVRRIIWGRLGYTLSMASSESFVRGAILGAQKEKSVDETRIMTRGVEYTRRRVHFTPGNRSHRTNGASCRCADEVQSSSEHGER